MLDIVVVGSANMDRTLAVEHLPRPGETVSGRPVVQGPGGKGANQAVAAARLGRSVAFVGCVGDDDEGRLIRQDLTREGVDVSALRDLGGTATGAAFICIDEHGENTIVVSPGANAHLAADDVRRAGAMLTGAAVVLTQLEIPLDAVAAALATASGIRVLNPAPARALPDGLLADVDVLIPNVTELATLTGEPTPATPADVARLARRLGVEDVIVTMGADGAMVVRGEDAVHVPTPAVDVVDTTGAGDVFCATVAHGLAAGLALVDATEQAVAVAAQATTVHGARVPLAPPTGQEPG